MTSRVASWHSGLVDTKPSATHAHLTSHQSDQHIHNLHSQIGSVKVGARQGRQGEGENGKREGREKTWEQRGQKRES
eukprot:1629749-Rhodomonas_salina.1